MKKDELLKAVRTLKGYKSFYSMVDPILVIPISKKRFTKSDVKSLKKYIKDYISIINIKFDIIDIKVKATMNDCDVKDNKVKYVFVIYPKKSTIVDDILLNNIPSNYLNFLKSLDTMLANCINYEKLLITDFLYPKNFNQVFEDSSASSNIVDDDAVSDYVFNADNEDYEQQLLNTSEEIDYDDDIDISINKCIIRKCEGLLFTAEDYLLINHNIEYIINRYLNDDSDMKYDNRYVITNKNMLEKLTDDIYFTDVKYVIVATDDNARVLASGNKPNDIDFSRLKVSKSNFTILTNGGDSDDRNGDNAEEQTCQE